MERLFGGVLTPLETGRSYCGYEMKRVQGGVDIFLAKEEGRWSKQEHFGDQYTSSGGPKNLSETVFSLLLHFNSS